MIRTVPVMEAAILAEVTGFNAVSYVVIVHYNIDMLTTIEIVLCAVGSKWLNAFSIEYSFPT